MRKRLFSTVLYTLLFTTFIYRANAQTTLTPGDLSFVGFNSALSARDGFAFVLWVPVSSGTTIKFTDDGFNNSSSSNTAGNVRELEQTITWTSSTAIAAGTVIRIEGDGSAASVTNTGTITVQNAGGATTPFMSLVNTGDNFFAFQGNYSTANNSAGTLSGTALFLVGFQGIGTSAAFLTSGATSTNTSYVPSDLASNNLFFAGSAAAAEYTGQRTGLTIAQYKAAVNNTANWTTYQSPLGVNSYTMTAFSTASPPAISANPPNRTICVSTNTTMSVTATGSPAYQWQVNTGSGFSNISNGGVYSGATTATLSFTSVTAGMSGYTYRCTATNGAGSATSTSATLTVSNPASSTGQTNIACNGGSTGNATVAPAGGISPYTYSWSPSGGTGSTASSLAAGNYSCTITDNIGCTVTKNFTISQPTALALSASSQTNVACNGGATGAASVNIATGGTPSYTYAWTPGNPSGNGTRSVSGLAAGNWTCTVTDANSCITTRSFTITQPSALTATSSQNNVNCFAGSDGTATVSPAGGSPSYTYSWSPAGGNAATATSLSEGGYTCTITDANGCSIPKSFTITAPSSTPGLNNYSLPASNQTITRPVSNGNFVSGTCELVTGVVASGVNPVSGNVTNSVWIEGSVPTYSGIPFVQRHYEITPAISASSVTGTVTLYFTQADFDNFNAHSGSFLNLPVNTADAAGKSNLRIGKYSGVSGNGTGLPDSYSSSKLVIDPLDNDIVWNPNSNSWEVSFAVSGFSGFIVQTSSTTLPVSWASFTANKQGNTVKLEWSTASEQSSREFIVQHSINGSDWNNIGRLAAAGTSSSLNSYTYVHGSPSKGNNYYRIVQSDMDGKTNYSDTRNIKFTNSFLSFSIIANPVADGVLRVEIMKTTTLSLYSADGRLLLKKQYTPGIQAIGLGRYGAGIYYLNNEEGVEKLLVL